MRHRDRDAIRAYAERVVNNWPPMPPQTAARVAALLRPTTCSVANARYVVKKDSGSETGAA